MSLDLVINQLPLKELTQEIRRTMRRSAKDAVQLGYMLRRVLEDKLYLEYYDDFNEYLECELSMDYTMASRFIGINKKYSVRGQSMEIAEEYEGYSQGLLIEMLSMTPEQEARVTPDMTVRQVREIKKNDRVPKQVQPPAPEAVPEREEVIIEGDFREIPEPVEVATSQPEESAEEENDLSRLRRLLDRKKQELDECMKVTEVEPLPDDYIFERKLVVAAIANMLCELEEMEKQQETESEPVQPELPILKNNDQRKEWLAAYKDWGIWYRDEHIDVNYYKYDFMDGSRLVVAEYPQRERRYGNTRTDNYHFHLLEKRRQKYDSKKTYDVQYNHETDSETYLVDFLKGLQKGAK